MLYFLSYSTPLGGAQRSLHATIEALQHDIDYKIVIPGEGEVYELYRELDVHLDAQGKGINVYGRKLHTYSLFKKIWLFFSEYLPYQWRMYKLIKTYKPDLIHSNSGRSILFNYYALKFTGKPLVNHIRGKFVPTSKRVQRNFALCDRLITVSKSIKEDYFEPHQKGKVVPIYNGVEPDKIYTDRHVESLLQEGKVIFGCFSNIVPFKGYHHLLRAMAILNDAGYKSQYKLVCLGKFPEGYETYHDYLKEQMQALGVDNLEFLGFQQNPFPYYATIDVSVLPSVSDEVLAFNDETITIRGNEGLPRVLIESMVFSNPLIASKIEGVPEMIDHGSNGFMVEPGIPEQLAEKMRYFLDNPSKIEIMGAVSRKIFDDRFHIAKNKADILKLYYDMV